MPITWWDLLLKTIINVYLLWKQNFNIQTDEHYKEKRNTATKVNKTVLPNLITLQQICYKEQLLYNTPEHTSFYLIYFFTYQFIIALLIQHSMTDITFKATSHWLGTQTEADSISIMTSYHASLPRAHGLGSLMNRLRLKINNIKNLIILYLHFWEIITNNIK